MLFQETTPDTSGYMIAGYVIAFLVMGLYVLSLRIRTRNLRQDAAMLEEMESSTPDAEIEGRPAGEVGGAGSVTKKAR